MKAKIRVSMELENGKTISLHEEKSVIYRSEKVDDFIEIDLSEEGFLGMMQRIRAIIVGNT